jgi:hypothetical protein
MAKLLHRHHIIPTHAGGTNDQSNIILLTVTEHAEAHRILYEKHGHWQDKTAWLGLAGIISHEDAVLRAHQSMLGKSHTSETKQKMSESAKRRHIEKPFSDKVKKQMGDSRRGGNNPMSGKDFSEEHRSKLSIALKGRVITDEWRRKISETKKKQAQDKKAVI